MTREARCSRGLTSPFLVTLVLPLEEKDPEVTVTAQGLTLDTKAPSGLVFWLRPCLVPQMSVCST